MTTEMIWKMTMTTRCLDDLALRRLFLTWRWICALKAIDGRVSSMVLACVPMRRNALAGVDVITSPFELGAYLHSDGRASVYVEGLQFNKKTPFVTWPLFAIACEERKAADARFFPTSTSKIIIRSITYQRRYDTSSARLRWIFCCFTSSVAWLHILS